MKTSGKLLAMILAGVLLLLGGVLMFTGGAWNPLAPASESRRVDYAAAPPERAFASEAAPRTIDPPMETATPVPMAVSMPPPPTPESAPVIADVAPPTPAPRMESNVSMSPTPAPENRTQHPLAATIAREQREAEKQREIEEEHVADERAAERREATRMESRPEPTPRPSKTAVAKTTSGKPTPARRSSTTLDPNENRSSGPVIGFLGGDFENGGATPPPSGSGVAFRGGDSEKEGASPSPSPDSNGASLARIDAVLQSMDWGQMAFDVPTTLHLRQSALVHLLASPTQTAEQLTALLRQQTTEPARVETARVQISGLMEARLAGSAFEIVPITPDEPQMVSRTQPTEWEWEIRPQQAGKESLHLTLNAIIRFEGKERPRVLRTFDRVIEVMVEPPAPATAAGSPSPALVVPASPAAMAADSSSASSTVAAGWHWPWPLVGGAGLALAAATGAAAWSHRRRTVARPIHTPVPAVRGGEAMDVFLSYSRRDEDRVLPLVEELRARGVSVWMDQGGIEGAALWPLAISEALGRARVCLLFASQASFGSAHVAREITLACEQGKPILPLHLEPVVTPPVLAYQLAGIQHIRLYEGDLRMNGEKVLRGLLHLGVVPPARAVEADAK